MLIFQYILMVYNININYTIKNYMLIAQKIVEDQSVIGFESLLVLASSLLLFEGIFFS